ncbi:MAG: hypothetical protein SWH54_10075 [Thermodesulfobacteriota bacterium]|nr:hypothetical protein [Thermodesulfobacteriota bacterium]
MMEKDKLRKADIFSGSIIFLFGLWIISQAAKMPMKDSWGGVQNVWFVSPALFPLFVGAMIMLLGALLVRTAVKEVGLKEVRRVLGWLISMDMTRFLKTPSNIRFYAITVLFFSLVYLNISRIDFFLCSVHFLMVFISMFYFDDDRLLKKMLVFYLAGTIFFIIYFVLNAPAILKPILPFASDWLMIVFILSYCIYTWFLIRSVPALRKKYRTSLILAVVTPFLIGPIFKYLLLVPMPTEGLIVAAMDAIWYFEF